MSEDVTSEVRDLFVNHTVDQVVIKCTDLKKQIHQTQDELRRLVGSRYRELLAACDKVVGMDAVCDAIQARSKKMRASHPLNARNTASGHPPGNESCSPARGGFGETEAVDEQLVRDAIVAKDVAERLHAVHVLASQGHLLDAAARFRGVVKTLGDFEGTINDHLFARSRESAKYIPNQIVDAICTSISRMVVQGLIMRPGVLEAYTDAHAALEHLYGCTSSVAIAKLLDIHMSIIKRAGKHGESSHMSCASAAMIHIWEIFCNLMYFLHHSKGSSSSPQLRSLCLEELLQLSSSDPNFTDTITLHVLGLGALQDSNSKYSNSLDGWALSPADAPPAGEVDANLIVSLLGAIQDQLERQAEFLPDVESVVKVEKQTSEYMASLMNVVNPSAFDHQGLVVHLQASLSTRIISLVRNVIHVASTRCDEICDAQTQADENGSSITPSSLQAVRSDATTRVISTITARLLAADSKTQPQGSTHQSVSPLATVCDDALAHAVTTIRQAVHRARSRGGSDGALGVREILEVSTKELTTLVNKIQQRTARARAAEQADVLFRFSHVVSSVSVVIDEIGTTFADASIKCIALNTLLIDLEELHSSCHALWIRGFAAELSTSLFANLKNVPWGLPANHFATSLANSWEIEKVEEAVVSVPHSCTPPLMVAIVKLQERLRAFGPTNLKASVSEQLHQAIADVVASTFAQVLSELLQPSDGSESERTSEEALFQLYFDARFMLACYAPIGGITSIAAVKRLFKQVESAIDMVNWSVTVPLIDRRVEKAVSAARLSLGLFSSSASRSFAKHSSSDPNLPTSHLADEVSIFKVKMHEEASRISLLPIATPAFSSSSTLGGTKSLFPSDDSGGVPMHALQRSSGNGKGTSGSLWGDGLKGIRSAFSWNA